MANNCCKGIEVVYTVWQITVAKGLKLLTVTERQLAIAKGLELFTVSSDSCELLQRDQGC